MPTREEMIAALKGPSAKPSRAEMIAALKGSEPERVPAQQEEQGLGSQAFDMAMRGLDYAGGLTRTGVAELADLATDEDIVQEGDWQKALQGQAPGTSEFIERSGAEPGVGTAVAGFVGDVALDPTTYLSGGLTALGKVSKLKKLLNPVGAVADVAGNKMIRSGVAQIDEALELTGKGKLSDILIKHDIVGTNKQIKKKLDKLSGVFSKERSAIYKKVDDAGIKVNTDDLIDDFSNFTSQVRSKTTNEMGDKVARNMEEAFFDAIPTKKINGEKVFAETMPIQKASNIKTQIRKSLPDSFYDGRVIKDQYKEGVGKLSNVFQKNIENAAETAVPGMGKELAEKNKNWSVLLDSDSPLGKEARKAAGKKLFTSVDAMILGGGQAAGDMAGGLKMLAMKKAGDLSKSTVFRTKGGKELKRTGTAIGEAMRRGAINYNRERDK
tara:strand:+ start:4523 stop:5842 length:1320 start_codon:yes stop_codon:yes gene_type:complete